MLSLLATSQSSPGMTFETTQEVLTRLKLIGTLKPGEKLDIRKMRIESNNILTPLKRMFFGDSREATYTFFCNTIERAFSILYSLASTNKTSDIIICSHIVEDMELAIEGIKNVQNTYKDDKMYFCNLETLMQTIHAKNMDVKEKYEKFYITAIPVAVTTTTPTPTTTLVEPKVEKGNNKKIM